MFFNHQAKEGFLSDITNKLIFGEIALDLRMLNVFQSTGTTESPCYEIQVPKPGPEKKI
jgi:hypothetical protein